MKIAEYCENEKISISELARCCGLSQAMVSMMTSRKRLGTRASWAALANASGGKIQPPLCPACKGAGYTVKKYKKKPCVKCNGQGIK